MKLWVVAKPRLIYRDAIDLFFSKIDLVDPLGRIFYMRPEFYSTKDKANHDEFFSWLMTAENLNSAADFAAILTGHTVNSSLSFLVTNRLFSPILPRSLAQVTGSNLRQRLLARLDRMLNTLSNTIPEKKGCLVFRSRPEDIKRVMHLGFTLGDGYRTEVADAACEMLQQSFELGLYKIKSSGIFTEVKEITVNPGDGPHTIYAKLLAEGVPLPKKVPSAWLKGRSANAFYLSEALVSKEIVSAISRARPTTDSTLVSFSEVFEKLLCTADRRAQARPTPAPDCEIVDFTNLSHKDASDLDVGVFLSLMWKY